MTCYGRKWASNCISRAAGGLHAFLRGRHPLTGDQVRAFLVLDPTFPRSMLGCALGAEQAARELEAMGSVTSHGGILRTVGLPEKTSLGSSLPNRIGDRGSARRLVVSANEAGAGFAIPSSSRSALSYGVIDDTTGPDDVLESVMSWRLEVTHHTGLRYSSPGGCLF